jgi:peptide/nickel transport system substrate-binding protein
LGRAGLYLKPAAHDRPHRKYLTPACPASSLPGTHERQRDDGAPSRYVFETGNAPNESEKGVLVGRKHWAAVLALGLTVAACGGSKKPSAAKQTSDSTTTSTAVSDAATTAPSGPDATSTTVAGAAPTPTIATKAASSSGTKKTATAGRVARTTTPPPKTQAVVQVTAPPTTAPAEAAQPGGSLTVLMSAEGHGFDPTLATGSAVVDTSRMFAEYDSLIYQDPPTGNVVPEVAESFTTPDAKTWTLKLRSGVKFTDGTTYDANAVKFNWDRHADPANHSTWLPTMKTLTYQVVDPLTVRITLNAPNGQFPRIVSRQLSFIASPTAIDKAGSQAAYNTNPVGAGPFMLKSWTRDSQMVLVRNPNYWNAPRPYLDQITFKVVVDEAQRKSTMQSSGADVAVSGVTQTAVDLEKSMTVYQSPSVNTSMFYMNMAKAPFNDINVRKAIQMATDLDEINNKIYAGYLEVPHGYFPSNYPYADPKIVFGGVDLTQAQKLIDDYVSRNGGKDIQFTFESTNSNENSALDQLIQAQLQKLNHVKVTISLQSAAAFVSDIVQKNFDAAAFTYFGPDPEPEWTGTVTSTGTRNFQGYASAAVDQAVVASEATTDTNARNQALKDAQKQLIADIPFFPIHRQPTFWISRPGIKDVNTFDDGGLFSDRLWIKTR